MSEMELLQPGEVLNEKQALAVELALGGMRDRAIARQGGDPGEGVGLVFYPMPVVLLDHHVENGRIGFHAGVAKW